MLTAVLTKLETYVALDDVDRALVSDIVATKQTFKGRTDLILEDDTPDCVQLITEGIGCRYKISAHGKRQIVAILLPGDFCDLNAYFLDAMDHCIATLAPCSVVKIPKETIAKLMDRPSIARALFMSALVDGATMRAWIANIGAQNAEQKVAHLCCELHARMRAVGLVDEKERAAIPMTQIDLGEALGLSLVHINRSLKSLRERGLMTLKGGLLEIKDPTVLENFGGFSPNYLHLCETGKRH